MKKNSLAFVVSFLVIFGAVICFKNNKNVPSQRRVENFRKEEAGWNNLHSSRFFEFKNDVAKNLAGSEKSPNSFQDETVQIGITSHHLPVAAPLIATLYKSFFSSKGPRDTFVVLGPDHFERCKAHVSLTGNGYITPFGELDIDQEMIDDIKNQGFNVDDDCFEGEHSIGVESVFIKYLFPEAKIVPIIFSSGTSDDEVKKLAEIIFKFKDRITVITSVDFSHYNSYEEANRLDRQSEKMIREMDSDGLRLKYVDSPPAVKTALSLSKKMGYDAVEVLSRGNSFEFTGKKKSTTGYMSIIFKEK